MKQTLQLKLTQHLTLTPQLQQSIRLLQLSTVELNAEVERMLQENPLLEKADGDDDAVASELPLAGPARASEAEARAEHPEETERRTQETAYETAEPAEHVERSDFEDYSPGDSDWGGGRSGSDDDDDGFYPQQVAVSTLRDHLMTQLAVLNLPLRDRQIVAALIDAVDEDGYLGLTVEDLLAYFPPELEIEPEEISIALKFLQSFDPVGVGARNAAECLALQLKALPETTPLRAEALNV